MKMDRRWLRLLFATVMLGFSALFVGCKGQKGTTNEALMEDAAKVVPHKESNDDDRFKTFAPILPASTKALGFFRAEDAWNVLYELASLMPHQFAVFTPEEIFERIRVVYGVQKDALKGLCAVAYMDKDAKVAVICQGGGLKRPFWAEIFEFQPLTGYVVKHRGLEVLIAEGMGFVVFGSVSGLQRLSEVQNKLYPPLSLRIDNMMMSQKDVANPLRTSRMGLWFVDPQSAPFCLLGSCYASAIYADGEKVEILVQSTVESAPLAQSTLMTYWDKALRSPYEMILQGKRGFRVPESALQRAGLIVETAKFEQRGYMVKLSAKGNIAFLLALLHLDTICKALEPLE